MIIRPSEVHDDPARARLGVGLAAEALGIECNMSLSSQWLVKIDGNERGAFWNLPANAPSEVSDGYTVVLQREYQPRGGMVVAGIVGA